MNFSQNVFVLKLTNINKTQVITNSFWEFSVLALAFYCQFLVYHSTHCIFYQKDLL